MREHLTIPVTIGDCIVNVPLEQLREDIGPDLFDARLIIRAKAGLRESIRIAAANPEDEAS